MSTDTLHASIYRKLCHLYRMGYTNINCLTGDASTGSPFIVMHRTWLRREPQAVLGIDKATGRVTLLWWESAEHRYLDARTKQPIGL